MIFWWPSQANAQTSYLPVQASDVAESYDLLYNVLTIVSLLAFIVLMGAMIFFIFKYKRKTDNDKTAYIAHNHFLEFLWSFIPLVVFLGVFYWGWKIYEKTRIMPKNAVQVNVTGRQFQWMVEYQSGKKVGGDEITFPVGKPVVLTMKSEDVIHSFFVPSFRVKQDVVPGYLSKLSFTPTKVGKYRLFCAEYCGAQHSGMMGWINVVEPHEFEEWVNTSDADLTPAQRGEKIYKLYCVACHSVDGSRVVGPSFKGLYPDGDGRVSQFADGSSMKVDENYIRESILNPQAKVVQGYPERGMNTFQGTLNDDQILHLIEYFKTLK